ncbi:ABC transporter ATP-binding protein [Salinibacterium sp. M195]|uniref:dipeptide ABC transporter ATP-binding protein n=1 Tax=Salinibacterium sp. M195 TaxID=2583374 RepID=UPI001C62C962|nr:ABC transporter ATP-binding protein [Salinibacterium sp. M195]QYH36366.1 ABC transporter ATP-binding protein [Salinibacterium sp. M195]
MTSAGNDEIVLNVSDLTVKYGDTTPVDGVSFVLRRGERIGLVGESGSGKSLTALSIMGLADRANLGGSVELAGTNLLKLSAKQMTRVRGGRVAMVYQDPMSSLNPVMTIGRQLTEAIRLHSTATKAAAHIQAVELLAEVGVPFPEERMKQYAHEFSGGMRQRVMIAMAMSGKPDVLIADEPTTALDVTTQAVIIDLLDRLASEHGTAVVLITHDLGVAAGFCETIHVMRYGKIVESAPATQLYAHPENEYSKVLLQSVVDLTIDVTQPIPVSSTEARATLAPVAPPAVKGAPGEVVLRVDGLNKTFHLGSGRRITAIDNVSFQVRRGETFGLVGESGSGKSTVSRAVLGLMKVDSGNVDFQGNNVHAMKPADLRSLRRRMQMVFQDPFSSLNRRQTVSQIIESPLIAHRMGTRVERQAKVAEMLELVGLGAEFADRYPRTMSGGQCQRVSIARSLVLDPDFMVLDESVSALDVSIQAQVLNLLRELQQRLGLTYLFISHDLAVIRYMADNIAVMRRGEIVELASRDELYANPQHEYTRSLMAAIPVADPLIERERRKTAAKLAAAYEVEEVAR